MNFSFHTNNRKIAIIGAGFVGASIAYALAIKEIAREIVLIDIDKNRAEGEAMDIRHGISGLGTPNLFAGDYSDCANCDMIIITAGRNRHNGESRLDLLGDNIKTMRNVVESIKQYYTYGVILVISNPVDVLTQKAHEWMELPNGMVFGTGCMLDTSRFIRSIADYTNMSTNAIGGYLVGEHGDLQIPIWSRVTVGGVSIEEFCDNINLPWNKEIQDSITYKTRHMGAEIIRGKGKTHYGIASCVCHIADTILNQKQTIASVSSSMQNEYGFSNISLSVPSVIGPNGVQSRIHAQWTNEEYSIFREAALKIQSTLNNAIM